ncbi:MAG: hypothetical protein MZW92_36720 [Comamonadaceae bacterium]|nr:hypothetical protein [Comamonadaceae bacterium]
MAAEGSTGGLRRERGSAPRPSAADAWGNTTTAPASVGAERHGMIKSSTSRRSTRRPPGPFHRNDCTAMTDLSAEFKAPGRLPADAQGALRHRRQPVRRPRRQPSTSCGASCRAWAPR